MPAVPAKHDSSRTLERPERVAARKEEQRLASVPQRVGHLPRRTQREFHNLIVTFSDWSASQANPLFTTALHGERDDRAIFTNQ
jgi:hypothetical protein